MVAGLTGPNGLLAQAHAVTEHSHVNGHVTTPFQTMVVIHASVPPVRHGYATLQHARVRDTALEFSEGRIVQTQSEMVD